MTDHGSDPGWLASGAHRAWATEQALGLLRFHQASLGADGWFTELDDYGHPLPTGCPPAPRPQQNLLTVTRSVHCYALAELLGVPGCARVVEAGLRAISEHHRDPEFGGYVEAVARGAGDVDVQKTAYGHAFVLLAASTALAAGHPGAEDLFDDALGVIDARFWSEADGAASEAYGREWVELEPYRGANSNMHLCESLLAAAAVTGRGDLTERARRLVRKFAGGYARDHGWLLPEHYGTDWQPRLEYNDDRLDDPFRPYGATVGHSLEWARLAVCSGLREDGSVDGESLEVAEALFARAVQVGWDQVNGGLAYTVGWDGRPANADHYWWPVAEGIATSSYLRRLTGSAVYEEWYRRLWEYAAGHLIDHERGGWRHLLDPQNRPKVHPWYGKPDLYHALQACLLPVLPVAVSAAAAAVSSGAAHPRSAAPAPGGAGRSRG